MKGFKRTRFKTTQYIYKIHNLVGSNFERVKNNPYWRPAKYSGNVIESITKIENFTTIWEPKCN